MDFQKIDILGTPVARVTYQSAFEIIQQLARESRPTAVCPSNTHILSEARHNPSFARVMSKFDLVFPYGMPVVWAMNLRGAGLSDSDQARNGGLIAPTMSISGCNLIAACLR